MTSGLLRPLYPHQRDAVRWGLACEDPDAEFAVTTAVRVDATGLRSTFYETTLGHRHLSAAERPFSRGFVRTRGGVMADVPGTGKTAFVLGMADATWAPPRRARRTADGYWCAGATLLVVPRQLVQQVQEGEAIQAAIDKGVDFESVGVTIDGTFLLIVIAIVGIGGLMLYMVFVMYRLAKDSGAGRFGAAMIFLSLGLGLVGFVTKSIIQLAIEV